jgi:hypothetical protein
MGLGATIDENMSSNISATKRPNYAPVKSKTSRRDGRGICKALHGKREFLFPGQSGFFVRGG